MLHPDFWYLVSLLKRERIPFAIMGNPFHLDDTVARRLKQHGCEKYQMSIDGMRITHDYLRRRGSFDETVEKIGCIRKAGIKSVIMSTVSGLNIGEIPDVVDVVVKHKVDIYSFGRYCPTGEDKSIDITPLEYRKFLDRMWYIYRGYKRRGVNTFFDLKDHLWTLYLYENGLFRIPPNARAEIIYGGCHCARSHMTILPNGDVYGCRRFESKVGNALEESLYDIFVWKEEIYRDYERFDKCRGCELLGFCRGCPAVAYGTCGDFYGVDPQCWKEI